MAFSGALLYHLSASWKVPLVPHLSARHSPVVCLLCLQMMARCMPVARSRVASGALLPNRFQACTPLVLALVVPLRFGDCRLTPLADAPLAGSMTPTVERALPSWLQKLGLHI